MGSRAAQNRREIEQSSARAPQPKRRYWRSNGWCTDHEEELRGFFAGSHVGAAGLHSSLGAQLDRMRDGLGLSQGSACDIPPQLRGAVERAEEVGAALTRIRQDGYADVLRAQYEPETTGRLEGFGALAGGEEWKKQGRPDLRAKLRRSDDDSDEGAEAATPAVAVLAIARELVEGRSVGGITPECRDPRAALRRICLAAGGDPAERGGEKPKKAAIEAARMQLGRIGTKTILMLKRAQTAYAKARRGASADEVRDFMAELHRETDAGGGA
jgi:hypothetical protein